ncbi:MAG: hypothetical protein AB1894_08850 [Chloroflexota bacterium]
MSSGVPTADCELRFLRAGLEKLESYLLSKEIYWPVGIAARSGETPYPQMTLGALLLALRRAQALAGTPAETAEADRLALQLDATRQRWRVAWEQKAAAEFQARLTLWRNFIEEYRQEPGNHFSHYRYEVGRRVLLHLLAEQAGELPEAHRALLSGLDAVLAQVLVPGDFIWEIELEQLFPREVFWYLFGRLPEQ